MASSTDLAPRVLIIEDDPMVRQYLRMALQTHDYVVIEAGTGLDGLSLVAAEQPDLVMLDLGLPDIGGLEVTRRLRAQSMVPVIILSGQVNETEKVAAFDAGADDYITKPYGLEELLVRVRRALHRWWLMPESGESIKPVPTDDLLGS